ncbi:MAG: FAD-dependent oxidoreductase, partial [Burkholderiaceae bacterium]|nr:FAD-dependent oxidoreductase [Burkholderiaceae bacterium]
MALQQQALIAGGGIGGLAAALACAQAGWLVRIYERATALAEVGAGIQLGPNAVRVLRGFGLDAALAAVA